MTKVPIWPSTIGLMIGDMQLLGGSTARPLSAECEYRAELLRAIREVAKLSRDVIEAEDVRNLARHTRNRAGVHEAQEALEEVRGRWRAAVTCLYGMRGRRV